MRSHAHLVVRALPVVASAVLLTACSATPQVASRDDTGPGDLAAVDAADDAADGEDDGDATEDPVEAYAACLVDEGAEHVTVGPDGSVGLGITVTDEDEGDDETHVVVGELEAERFAAAEEVCRERVPEYEPPSIDTSLDADALEAARAFAACARDNGFPDLPEPQGEFAELEVPAGTTEDQFATVFEACAHTVIEEFDDGGKAFASPNFTGAFDPAWLAGLLDRVFAEVDR